MNTILVLSFSYLDRDPRVNRQIRFLCEYYHVIAAGMSDPNLPNVDFIPLSYRAKNPIGKARSIMQILSRQYEAFYWRQGHVVDSLQKLGGIEVDYVLANEIDSLPLALRLAKHAKVIFDAHEYSPLESEDSWVWMIRHHGYKTYLCNTYIPKVDAMTTVCQGIAERYERETGVRPTIITNAPDYHDLEPVLKPNGGPDSDSRIRMVHHGLATPHRKLEQTIEMMGLLDERFTLDMLLVPSADASYLEKLKQLATKYPCVRILPPLPIQQLVPHAHQYDIGVFLLPPTTFNYRHALPNKFFEFIQARLAVAIGPSVEMARIVKEYECGIVADDFSPISLARLLNSLDHEQINHYKQRAHAAAPHLSAQQNRERLLTLFSTC